MPPRHRQIPTETIQNEIYKTFETYNQTKNITIADYLQKLDLETLFPSTYRSIKYPYHALLRLLIYQQLKGIKFQTQLHRHLKTHIKERNKLGLKKTPDQRTISHFTNHILNNETKQHITIIVKTIDQTSQKFGIFLDTAILKPQKPKKRRKQRSIFDQKIKKNKELSRLFKKRFISIIDLNLGKNAQYTKTDFIDLFLQMCDNNDFAENRFLTLKADNIKTPNSDTLLYHLKNYKDRDQIQRMFITMFEMIWETARKANHFPRKVDCSIDFTDWHFYGEKNSLMVVETKPDKGTCHCYKFATITITERNQRFTLLAVPVGPFDNKQKILRILLDYALQRIKIKRLYIDRGFYDSKSIGLFKRYQIKFLMPCVVSQRIRNLCEFLPLPRVINDFEFVHTSTTFNLVLVEDEYGNKRGFATNIDFDENEVGLTKRLFYLYGKRWGIETSYRVKKHFRPVTTSKNYFIRLFYFLSSVLLYNLWLLIDILICISIKGKYDGKHLINSKLFSNIISKIDPGGS
jgi:putative transposase